VLCHFLKVLMAATVDGAAEATATVSATTALEAAATRGTMKRKSSRTTAVTKRKKKNWPNCRARTANRRLAREACSPHQPRHTPAVTHHPRHCLRRLATSPPSTAPAFCRLSRASGYPQACNRQPANCPQLRRRHRLPDVARQLPRML